MGLRYRRRLRIMRGLYLNLSKSGVSTSIGRPGATLNISKQGTRTTLGLPGSGLSWRSPARRWGGGDGTDGEAASSRGLSPFWGAVLVLGAVVIAFVIAAQFLD